MSAGDDLRLLMRRFPTGVGVVTVSLESERLGLTVGTLVSLSLEPPLLGFAVSKQAALHELLRRSEGFAVSLLAAGQEQIAQHFARGVPPIAHWEGVPLRQPLESSRSRGISGTASPPLIGGALGWFECERTTEHDVGDHTFFVGEALRVELGAGEPLVHVDQTYRPL